MIKSVIFLSLYTAAGIGSWGAYSFITEQDSSLDSLSKLAAQIQPVTKSAEEQDVSNIIYRWKDYKGNWNYEDSPYSELSFDSYEDELQFLKKLKESREAITSNKTNTNELAQTDPESASVLGQLQKLFADAKNVEKLLDQRQQTLEEMVNQQSK